MATLRVRFSGMCLFHMSGQKVLVRVLKHGHKPELWVDPTTARVQTGRNGKPDEICMLEGDGLTPVQRRVEKYTLAQKESIAFANGDGGGPTDLPGVASLKKLNAGGGVDLKDDVAAVITLNRGEWDRNVPRRTVRWHPPRVRSNEVLPLWTDLIVHSGGSFFEMSSDKQPGGWKFYPFTKTAEVRLWILSDFPQRPNNPNEAGHFVHHFDHVMRPPNVRAWPELVQGLPPCFPRETQSLAGSQMATLAGSSAFCPDGQYEEP